MGRAGGEDRRGGQAGRAGREGRRGGQEGRAGGEGRRRGQAERAGGEGLCVRGLQEKKSKIYGMRHNQEDSQVASYNDPKL